MSDDDTDLAIAGEPGARRDVRELPRISPSSLKGAAQLKTADLSRVSAVFDGERVEFEPWLSLRLIERDRIVSWAVYQPASSNEHEEAKPRPPDVAWRRVEWDNSRDVHRFKAALDKAAYLRGDTQIDSRIRFGRLAELPRRAAAGHAGSPALPGGGGAPAADRPDVIWQRLYVSVADVKVVMNLDYAPWATRCGEVESWAYSWSTLVDSLEDDGTVPGIEIMVRYQDSFEELVTRTRRSPRPHVDDRWLTGER